MDYNISIAFKTKIFEMEFSHMNASLFTGPLVGVKSIGRKSTYLLSSVLITLIMAATGSGVASAQLSGSDFPEGRIIDDVIFTDKTTMTAPQIQLFLESKVAGGQCDRHRATYNANYNPPWTCLFEFQQNPVTGDNNYGLFDDNGTPDDNSDDTPAVIPGGKTAAEIIWQAAQDHDINPQVLIVLLQKEQGLVTDNWPWTIQYGAATGYLCPDTAPCDPTQADFYKQVDGAASLFRYYLDNLDFYWYRIGQNDILYHPNHSCGTQSINIENAATVALYLYTPYTPNQAALDNLYGTGDSCSAYGNRNFWRYFNDWFGTTEVEEWSYQFESSSYSLVALEPGETRDNQITLRNSGNNTWYAEGSEPAGQPYMTLAASDEALPFVPEDSDQWDSSLKITMTPSVVGPGEEATFYFEARGPYQMLENKYVKFVPELSNGTRLADINMQMIFRSTKPSWQLSSVTNLVEPLLHNENRTITIELLNTGTGSWYSDSAYPSYGYPTRLAMKNYIGSPLAVPDDPNWLGTSNQIRLTQDEVEPGEVGTFTFDIDVPIGAGYHKLHFVPVLDGVTFLDDISFFVVHHMDTPVASYEYITASNPSASMAPGEEQSVYVDLRNTGNVVWRGSSESDTFTAGLITRRPVESASEFYTASGGWHSLSRMGRLTYSVAPDEVARFAFNWKAPADTGTYEQYFSPYIDGYIVMRDVGMLFLVDVE